MTKPKPLKPIIRSEKNFLHNPTYSTLCCVGLHPYFGRQVDETYLKLDQFRTAEILNFFGPTGLFRTYRTIVWALRGPISDVRWMQDLKVYSGVLLLSDDDRHHIIRDARVNLLKFIALPAPPRRPKVWSIVFLIFLFRM